MAECEWAIVCDYAFLDAGGKMCLIGIFDVDCSDLHFRWNKLAMEYQDLWNAGDVEDADRRLGQLNERRAEASKSGTAFPYSKRRMLRWYELVVEHRAPKAA